MKVAYELSFVGKCPADDSDDIYRVIVEATDIVPVEDILRAVKALPEKQFQEAITAQLSKALGGVRVITVGYHSGVKTTCTCEG